MLGGTPEAVAHALLVRQWSADVVYFPHTSALRSDERSQLRARGIDVVDGPVARLVVDDDRLTGIQLESGRVVPRAAVFVRPRFVPHDDLLTRLGCTTDDNGWVVADTTGRASVRGVWVGRERLPTLARKSITAAGEGSAAAIAINVRSRLRGHQIEEKS